MATILGPDGRPAWRNGKPIMQEIASIERDIQRVFYGRVLLNTDETLLSRGQGKGLKIYEELKRDAHAGAVLGKRKLAVTSRPWSLEPASDSARDKQAAELVKTAFEHLRFNHICKRLLEATLKGYAVSEVMWELREGQVLPRTVIARAPQRFVFALDGALHLRTPSNMFEGEPMPPRKFIVHRRGADDDNPYGAGIGGMLFWPVFFKRNTITFWLTFADKFGSPTAVGKYPPGADEGQQQKLLDALAALAQDAGVIVPQGMLIELLEAQRSGSVDTYEKLVRYMDEQMSKAVLGETMSTTAASTGLGSSQASVQNEVRLEVAQDDADELDETLNETLVRWIVDFNLPGAGYPLLKHDFSEPEDLAARATRDKTLVEMGWEPTEQYMLDTYGEGWVKAEKPEPPPMLPGLGLPGLPAPAGRRASQGAEGDEDVDEEGAFAEGRPLQHARRRNREEQDTLAQAADALSRQWRAMHGRRVEDLLAMLEDTGDLALFRERMARLADEQPDPQAVETIARATFAGHLLGRGRAQQQRGGLFSRLMSVLRRGR